MMRRAAIGQGFSTGLKGSKDAASRSAAMSTTRRHLPRD
jgi:hypothetical protein